jgi:hypothetical protein
MHEWYRSLAFLAAATLVVVLSTRTATTSTGTDVVTYHNDVARTGQNLNESILTPATVSVTTFGKIGVFSVDGKVDAQPLHLSSVTIPGNGTHDVLYVATSHDSVYAMDAATGARSGARRSPAPANDQRHAQLSQVTPEIRITATPVIDRSRGRMA